MLKGNSCPHDCYSSIMVEICLAFLSIMSKRLTQQNRVFLKSLDEMKSWLKLLRHNTVIQTTHTVQVKLVHTVQPSDRYSLRKMKNDSYFRVLRQHKVMEGTGLVISCTWASLQEPINPSTCTQHCMWEKQRMVCATFLSEFLEKLG